MNEHDENDCPARNVSCDDCKKDVLRMDMEKHHTECPERVIKCSFSRYGCEHKLKRKLMDAHLNQNKEKHSELKVKYIYFHFVLSGVTKYMIFHKYRSMHWNKRLMN